MCASCAPNIPLAMAGHSHNWTVASSYTEQRGGRTVTITFYSCGCGASDRRES